MTEPSPREPRAVAKAIRKIYEEEFGGKDRGRFVMSRQQLRELARRGRLEDKILDEIIDEAYERGLVITDLGDDFSVVEAEVMRGYRKLPSRLVEEFANK